MPNEPAEITLAYPEIPVALSLYVLCCDPRVPLQRSKWENQENDNLGSKNAFLGGPSWNHLNGLFGHFMPSLNNIEGGH